MTLDTNIKFVLYLKFSFYTIFLYLYNHYNLILDVILVT